MTTERIATYRKLQFSQPHIRECLDEIERLAAMNKRLTDRGLVCCFCGESWPYTGETPPEPLLRLAVDHEMVCPENRYVKEIERLRAALTRIMNDQSGLDVTGLARIAREALEETK